MTPNDEQAIRGMNPENAIRDILDCVSETIVKRSLTEQESHDLTVKVKFWFLTGFHKGKLAMQDSVKKFADDSCKRLADIQYLDAIGSDSCKVTTSK